VIWKPLDLDSWATKELRINTVPIIAMVSLDRGQKRIGIPIIHQFWKKFSKGWQ
jgi:hypothetical protein